MGSQICISEREKLCTSPRENYKKTTKIPKEYYENNNFGLNSKKNNNILDYRKKNLFIKKKLKN